MAFKRDRIMGNAQLETVPQLSPSNHQRETTSPLHQDQSTPQQPQSRTQIATARCQCQYLASQMIPAQHTKIKDIQQQISAIRNELCDLLPALAPNDERIMALKDKKMTLQWSLSDQKERLETFVRNLSTLQQACTQEHCPS